MDERPFADFDPGLIEKALARMSVSPDVHEEQDVHDQKAADAILFLLRFICGRERLDSRAERIAGRRALLILWALNPQAMPGCSGESISLRALARRLGTHPNRLARTSHEVSKAFGILNAYQRAHNWRGKAEHGNKPRTRPQNESR